MLVVASRQCVSAKWLGSTDAGDCRQPLGVCCESTTGERRTPMTRDCCWLTPFNWSTPQHTQHLVYENISGTGITLYHHHQPNCLINTNSSADLTYTQHSQRNVDMDSQPDHCTSNLLATNGAIEICIVLYCIVLLIQNHEPIVTDPNWRSKMMIASSQIPIRDLVITDSDSQQDDHWSTHHRTNIMSSTVL